MSKGIRTSVLAALLLVASGLTCALPAAAAGSRYQAPPTTVLSTTWHWLERLVGAVGGILDPNGQACKSGCGVTNTIAPEGGGLDPDGKHSRNRRDSGPTLPRPVSARLLGL